MDGSRETDLRMLKERFNDARLPLDTRNRAYRKFQDIAAQAKDTHLTELRYRLVRAHRNKDTDIAQKIEATIKDYSKNMGYGRA